MVGLRRAKLAARLVGQWFVLDAFRLRAGKAFIGRGVVVKEAFGLDHLQPPCAAGVAAFEADRNAAVGAPLCRVGQGPEADPACQWAAVGAGAAVPVGIAPAWEVPDATRPAVDGNAYPIAVERQTATAGVNNCGGLNCNQQGEGGKNDGKQ